jgi:membrane protein insertase Oxa1/YidC/SpoIIIJ
MPLMFGWMMFSWHLPSAFTFYWLVMNIVSTIQQYRIIKQYRPVTAGGGGAASSGGGGTPPSGGSKVPSGGGGNAPSGGNGRRTDAEVSSAARSDGKGGGPSRSGKRSGSRKRSRGARV